MKIDRVIVSTNRNPLYFDFWTPFSYVWKEKFGIEPVLVYVDDGTDSVDIDDRWGTVIRVNAVSGVPEYLQTQWSRFFFTRNYPDDVCMVSDIDMFPLSKSYFVDDVASFQLDENSHLHMNGNGVSGRFDDWMQGNCNLSVCYHVNYGKRFSEIFDMDSDWESEIRKLNSMNLGKDQSAWAEHLRGMVNWGAEEDYTTAILRSKVESGLTFYTTGLYGRRFDRSCWNHCKSAVRQVDFVDCHSLRPYAEHKNEILDVLRMYHGEMNV